MSSRVGTTSAYLGFARSPESAIPGDVNPAPEQKAAWLSPARLLGLGVLGFAFLAGGRELLIRRVFGNLTQSTRDVALWLHEALPPGESGSAFGAPPGDPLGDLLRLLEAPPAPASDEPSESTLASGSPDGARAPQSKVKSPPVPPASVTLTRRTVLALAQKKVVPRGVRRPSSGDLPAGIEIVGGQGLGIGWYPGDRLIAVEGVSVSEPGLVVGRVLELRRQRAAVIRATLARRTAAGVRTFVVLVEQPYADSPEAPKVPVGAGWRR